MSALYSLQLVPRPTHAPTAEVLQAINGITFASLQTFTFSTSAIVGPRYIDNRYNQPLAALIRSFNPQTMHTVKIGYWAENHPRTVPVESYTDIDDALDTLHQLTSVTLIVNEAQNEPQDRGVYRLIEQGAFFPKSHARGVATIEYSDFDGEENDVLQPL